MIQNNSALDGTGQSTNSWLDAKDILIKWNTCADMADLVSSDISRPGFFSAVHVSLLYHFLLELTRANLDVPLVPIWTSLSVRANLAVLRVPIWT
jgi:hypothetical protein